MTGKTIRRDDRGEPAKMHGWFSWRHKTREAHDAARERYLAEHGRAARRRKAAERKAKEAPHEPAANVSRTEAVSA